MAASTGASVSTPEQSRGGFFRNTFKAMSDWGDEFERRHFEGDLKSALLRAPQKVKGAGSSTFRAMNDWGDEFERRHFEGDFVGALAKAPQRAGAALSSTLETVDSSLERLMPLPTDVESAPPTFSGAAASSERPWEALLREQERTRLQDVSDGSVATMQWKAAEQLRLELDEERERRRGRQSALDTQAEALRMQRAEITEERVLVAMAEERRSVADRRAYASERELAQLQERHHALLSRKAMHEAELQHHAADAVAARAAAQDDEEARAAEGPRAWARRGPEMEALKEAKLELAEVLSLVDEARLHQRKELRRLQEQIVGTDAANTRFWLASDGYTAPDGSFRKSLRQLLAMAKG